MALRKKPLHVSLVGAGSVGVTLAALLSRKGYRIESVVSRGAARLRRAAQLVHCRQTARHVKSLSARTDFLLIATSDDAIEDAAAEIARSSSLHFEELAVAHTSGVLGSDALAPLAKKGALTFSLHPIQTFPRHQSLATQLRSMQGISYGIEGSPLALRVAKSIVKDLGGSFFVVPKEKKILYHLACVFASNYSVAALAAAEELGLKLGDKPLLPHLAKLIDASVGNALLISPRKALTGPLVRGDCGTLKKHLTVLRRERVRLLPLYRELGRYLLEIGMKRGSMSKSEYKNLRKLLTSC